MQSAYPEAFERDMGTSEAEWVTALPRALAAAQADWQPDGERRAVVALSPGRLVIDWEPLPERRIALLVMKRLLVRFQFEGTDAQQRLAFMKPFDLTLQRGGG
ncbi:MAG: hypothetical protein EP308_09995 [Burkholderiales bacterium]|nr:MAG: hypothetical protein EP308_09995 [Burkholderiales bacterium]